MRHVTGAERIAWLGVWYYARNLAGGLALFALGRYRGSHTHRKVTP